MAQKLDRYELIDVIGVGAFATVWRAHDPVIDEQVAIKVLADNWAHDPEIRQRFLKEAKVALQVTNEHLIRVHHVAESADNNTPYIVMGIADGGTLEKRIRERRDNPHSVDEALRILREAAIATSALHTNGILHRDLKPANILFQAARGGHERLVLGDFGLARAIDRSALTLVAGTPAYAAPEQAAGVTQLTEQADLFALGVIFLELVTGQLPTSNSSMADSATTEIDIEAALTAPVAPVFLEPKTRQLVESLISPNPALRPASAQDVANTISSILGDHRNVVPTGQPAVAAPPAAPVAATPFVASSTAAPTHKIPAAAPLNIPTAAAPATEVATEVTHSPGSKRNIGVIAAGAVGLIGLVIIGALLLSGRGSDPEPDVTAASTASTSVPTIDSTVSDASPETSGVEAAPEDASPTTDEPADDRLRLIPDDLPLPNGAIIDEELSQGGVSRTYDVSGTPQDVLAHFQALDNWDVANIRQDTDIVQFDVSDADNVVVVTAQARPNTAGADLTVMRIDASSAVVATPDPNAEIPDGFPTPPGAIFETSLSTGNTQHTFTVASTPQNVISFYETNEWSINATSTEDPITLLELTNADETVSARIEPITNTSGVALVRLTITAIS